MLTSPPYPRKTNSGFTLIEVMVVLVIMGVLVGFATLNLGSGGQADRLQEQSRRLEAKIRLAAEDAVLEGRDLGIGFSRQAYQFYELQGGEAWASIGNDPQLGPTQLDEDLELQLWIEDIPVVMSREAPEKPQVFIVSSGETTPFSLEFLLEDAEPVQLRINMLGQKVANENDF